MKKTDIFGWSVVVGLFVGLVGFVYFTLLSLHFGG
jgi:hypothetical protein